MTSRKPRGCRPEAFLSRKAGECLCDPYGFALAVRPLKLPGEYIPLIIGTLVLVGGKVVHLVLHLLHR